MSNLIHLSKDQVDALLIDIESKIIETPNDYNLWVAKAILMMDKKDYDGAAKIYKDLHDLGIQPGSTMNNVALCFHKAKDYPRALEHYEHAYKYDPTSSKIIGNMALIYEELDRYDEAQDFFTRAIAIENSPLLRFNEGNMHLSLGNMARGWEGFAQRFAANKLIHTNPSLYDFPLWDGQPLAGSHPLIWTEQGMGDEVLTSTMFSEVIAVAREVTILVSKRYLPICKRIFEQHKHVHVYVRERGLDKTTIMEYVAGILTPPDFQLSMGELGRSLRNQLAAFPEPTPFLTSIRSKKMGALRRAKRACGFKRPLIGLAWGSNNADFGETKSINVGYLAPLLSTSDVSFVSLQHRFDQQYLRDFCAHYGVSLFVDTKIGPEYLDIEDCLAQIDAMDLVITTSNSVAHMAGALGKETWLILPKGRGRLWFWFRNTKKCAWYKNVRLFEQHVLGDWEGVIDEVTKELELWRSLRSDKTRSG